MTRESLIVCAAALLSTTILYAQTPTITSVVNESGSASLCPGVISFVNGANLGTNAVLTPNSPGVYIVNFTVPSGLTTGNQTLALSIGGLTSNTSNLAFSTAPIVSQATNAASYILYGPSRPIAQGSVIVLKGNN